MKEKGVEVVRDFDEDLPGYFYVLLFIRGGQFYCTPCGRYFKDEESLHKHELCKIHKKKYDFMF